jgi:hypothetical protein
MTGRETVGELWSRRWKNKHGIQQSNNTWEMEIDG